MLKVPPFSIASRKDILNQVSQDLLDLNGISKHLEKVLPVGISKFDSIPVILKRQNLMLSSISLLRLVYSFRIEFFIMKSTINHQDTKTRRGFLGALVSLW
jgi:hypothetical protein